MLSENFQTSPQDNLLEDWLQDNLGKELFNPDLSGDRLIRHFSRFKESFKELRIPTVIIAGTNGKGEVSLGLEALLLKRKQKPFLWTSPHILSVRERFSFNGYPIASDELLALFHEHQELCRELSYYEFLFYCFCDWITKVASHHENVCVLFEVGLGGRLDATNFFDCDLAALVSIGRDHMDVLGPTLSHILKEKVAVARPGHPLVSAVSQEFLVKELRDYCRENGVLLDHMETSSLAHFKDVNAKVIERLYCHFCDKVGLDYIPLVVPEKLWARPFEVTYKTWQFILVGSHNLDGLRHLANWVNSKRSQKTCSSDYDEVWVGMSRKPGPELDQCLKLIALSPCLGSELVLCGYEHPRATQLSQLRSSWEKINQVRKVRFEKSWQQVVQKEQEPKKVLVCGSYFFVGDILRNLPSLKFH